MATMVYANPGWTNGSPPALNKTNLDLLSNALASIGSAGSASVRDSDRVAGTVPAAGGVSLLGLSSLGTSWLTALAAAATSGSANGIDAKTLAGTTPGARGLTALSQASTLDADTVSGYGIGTIAKNLGNVDVLAQTKNGLYLCGASSTNTPEGHDGLLIVDYYNTVLYRYIYQDYVSGIVWEYRSANGVAPSGWKKIWDSYSDGNGGQPPAPRPTEGTPAGGANAQGQFIASATIAATGTVYASGASNLSGTWEATAMTIINATGLVDPTLTGTRIIAGTWFTVPAGKTTYIWTKRIA